MKKIILLILTFTVKVIAQDGSDIKYVKMLDLNNSYVGKMVHLDFYNRSFGGNNNLSDKVNIKLENKQIEFLEQRVDNGYNNWFLEQYLESTEFIDSYKIRITMCKIEEIKSDSIKVILFLEYRDKKGQLNSEKTNTIQYDFPKKMLTEILVRK